MAEDRGNSYAHTVGMPPDDDDEQALSQDFSYPVASRKRKLKEISENTFSPSFVTMCSI